MISRSREIAHDAAVERLRLFYNNLPLGIGATITSAVVVAAVLWDEEPRFDLLGWLGSGLLISILRYLDHRKFSRAQRDHSTEAWYWRAQAGAAISGLFWCFAAIVLFPAKDFSRQMFVVFALTSIWVGAMVAYGAVQRCYLSFVIPIVVALLLRLISEHAEIYYAMAVLSAVTLVIALRAAEHLDRMVENVLETRTANAGLTRALQYQATHDSLVDLVNHREFKSRLARVTDDAPRSGEPYALVFLDLDRFKGINDRGGHAAGDETLRRVSEILKRHAGARDTAARLGGDEFALLLPACTRERAEREAAGILAAIEKFELDWEGGERFRVGASIGIAYAEGGAHDAAALLRAADSACYAAKNAGRGRIEVCPADSGREPSGRFRISDLRGRLT